MALLGLDEDILKERFQEYFTIPGVIKRSKHALKEGLIDKYYFDFDDVVCEPSRCEEVIDRYLLEIKKVEGEPDFLAFLEKREGSGTVGAITLAGAISIETGVPFVLIRLGKELQLERVKFPIGVGEKKVGQFANLNGILISDHCTTGTELLKAIDAIKHIGGSISDVIVYSYRNDQLKLEEFEKATVVFHGFLDLSKEPLCA